MTNHTIPFRAFLAVCAFLLSTLAIARDFIDEPVMLIATPELRDHLFGATVLLVTPIGGGQHIGFIINHPTRLKLSEMFPEHEPSKNVSDPVFLGGPQNVEALFALVHRPASDSTGRIRLATDLYLEIERDKVDGVIENEHGKARFFAGIVVWRPGELAAEIRDDYWYVQAADADLVLRKSTSGMWEELIKKIARDRNAIKAGNDLAPMLHPMTVTLSGTALHGNAVNP